MSEKEIDKEKSTEKPAQIDEGKLSDIAGGEDTLYAECSYCGRLFSVTILTSHMSTCYMKP